MVAGAEAAGTAVGVEMMTDAGTGTAGTKGTAATIMTASAGMKITMAIRSPRFVPVVETVTMSTAAARIAAGIGVGNL